MSTISNCFVQVINSNYWSQIKDAAFVLGSDVMVKFALVLILDHKKELMECCGLEQIMNCFKSVFTNVTPKKADEYVRKVMNFEGSTYGIRRKCKIAKGLTFQIS